MFHEVLLPDAGDDGGGGHAYLVDLNKLPYQEQIYWSAFNEWPKGDLSPRAVCNDFKGEVYGESDPLHLLKLKVEALDANPPPWWKPRGEELRQVVHPPLTDSVDQWADAMLYLDKLLVEGFLKKRLRLQLAKLGRDFDDRWGSLMPAQECLAGSGMSVVEAKTTMAPLKQVHYPQESSHGETQAFSDKNVRLRRLRQSFPKRQTVC